FRAPDGARITVRTASGAGEAEVMSVLLSSQTRKSRLSPDELVALADQMVAAQDPVEADRLEVEILAGFYGK
ncbi:MAG: hypothetical protein ABI016_11315, partial [Chthoniobacterales bacterium]